MKDLLEKNKWLAIYLIVVFVSFTSFSLFVQAQGADVDEQRKAENDMKAKVKKVNAFTKRSVEVTEENLRALASSQVDVDEDLKKLKAFLSSRHSYRYDKSWKSLSGLKVKQKMIDSVNAMKKVLRDGDIYYDRDSDFGFEKYVGGIPSASDALSLACFSGLTMELFEIGVEAKVSEVVEVKSKQGLKLNDSLVGRYAKYRIHVSGTGESIKAYLEGLKKSKNLYIVIKEMKITSEVQIDEEFDPVNHKSRSKKEGRRSRSEKAVEDAVRQAKVAFEKTPVLALDIDVNIYLIEGK